MLVCDCLAVYSSLCLFACIILGPWYAPICVYMFLVQLIVGWITTLDSVPEIDMLDYLPQLMEGLFSMLSDNNREVKKVCMCVCVRKRESVWERKGRCVSPCAHRDV